MITVKTHPANREQFNNLKVFCQKFLQICDHLQVVPIIYGSLAFFAYVKDKTIVINDLDFLVPEKFLKKIAKSLSAAKIQSEYSPKWHSIEITDGDLKIEFDSREFWQPGRTTR